MCTYTVYELWNIVELPLWWLCCYVLFTVTKCANLLLCFILYSIITFWEVCTLKFLFHGGYQKMTNKAVYMNSNSHDSNMRNCFHLYHKENVYFEVNLCALWCLSLLTWFRFIFLIEDLRCYLLSDIVCNHYHVYMTVSLRIDHGSSGAHLKQSFYTYQTHR